MRTFEEITETTNEEKARFLLLKVSALSKLKKTDEAIKDVEKALTLTELPNHLQADLIHHKCLLLCAQNKFKKAQVVIGEGLRLAGLHNEKRAQLTNMRINCILRQKLNISRDNYELMLTDITTAIGLVGISDCTKAKLLLNKGLIYNHIHEPDKAILRTTLGLALQNVDEVTRESLYDVNAFALIQKGFTYIELHQAEKASEIIQSIEKLPIENLSSVNQDHLFVLRVCFFFEVEEFEKVLKLIDNQKNIHLLSDNHKRVVLIKCIAIYIEQKKFHEAAETIDSLCFLGSSNEDWVDEELKKIFHPFQDKFFNEEITEEEVIKFFCSLSDRFLLLFLYLFQDKFQDDSMSLKLLSFTEKLKQQIQDPNALGFIFYLRASYFFNKGDQESSVKETEKGLQLKARLPNSYRGELMHVLARNYLSLSNFESPMRLAQRGLKIVGIDSKLMSKFHLILATCYNQKKKYQDAEKAANAGLALQGISDDIRGFLLYEKITALKGQKKPYRHLISEVLKHKKYPPEVIQLFKILDFQNHRSSNNSQ